jgi:hypothetical protein
MGTSQIPENVHAAIKQCWPDGVVHELATDESYFHEIHPRLERDLRKIRGASLRWQSEDAEGGAGWNEDENDELPSIDDWQSYYVFFLAPHGKEFHFACETTGVDEAPDAEEDMSTETTYPGEGWIGCAAGVCLAAPYAVINLCSYSRYEDGTTSTPDVESFIYCDKTQDRIDTDQYHQELLSQAAFQKLEGLRRALASILAKHGIQVLDRAVLNLRVTGLKASEEVFLEEPLRVQDAFFFRGA